MDKKKLILLVSALVVAVATALVARSMLAGSSAPQAEAAQAEPEGPKVLVAKRSLPVGTIVTADAVAYQLWPQELVQDAYFIDGEANMETLLGTVVRFPVTAGEPVTQGSLVAPGDRGFLAAALGPGMRAITVPVTARTGVGGFIFPGDFVDLMLTQAVSGEGSDEGGIKATETILTNLRVLATDQATESTTTEDGKTIVRNVRTVTMEVTPRLAEMIAVAQTLGTLSLSLRSIADNQADLDRAIAAGNVNLPDNASPEQEEALLRQAVARPSSGPTTFVTGGDVSRFQRRTIAPARREQATNTVYVENGVATSQPAGGLAIPSGPSVRVTRRQNTVIMPVARGAGALLDRQAAATNSGARAATTGMTGLR